MPNVLKTFGRHQDKELRDQQVRKVTDMAGSIRLGDLEAPALDTASEHLGTASSAEHETTFEHQAFHGDSATNGSRSMPGSFPEDTPPPSPTSSTGPAIENHEGSIDEEAHAPSIDPDVDGPHTPSASSVNHGAHSVSSTGDNAHTPVTANADDRFDQAGQAEEGHAGQAAEGETPQPGRLTRWSERNHKFGDMLDKSLKPYTVPLTVAGVTAGLGIGIYNATKK